MVGMSTKGAIHTSLGHRPRDEIKSTARANGPAQQNELNESGLWPLIDTRAIAPGALPLAGMSRAVGPRRRRRLSLVHHSMSLLEFVSRFSIAFAVASSSDCVEFHSNNGSGVDGSEIVVSFGVVGLLGGREDGQEWSSFNIADSRIWTIDGTRSLLLLQLTQRCTHLLFEGFRHDFVLEDQCGCGAFLFER